MQYENPMSAKDNEKRVQEAVTRWILGRGTENMVLQSIPFTKEMKERRENPISESVLGNKEGWSISLIEDTIEGEIARMHIRWLIDEKVAAIKECYQKWLDDYHMARGIKEQWLNSVAEQDVCVDVLEECKDNSEKWEAKAYTTHMESNILHPSWKLFYPRYYWDMNSITKGFFEELPSHLFLIEEGGKEWANLYGDTFDKIKRDGFIETNKSNIPRGTRWRVVRKRIKGKLSENAKRFFLTFPEVMVRFCDKG